MIFTKPRSYENIVKELRKEDTITIFSCQSCCRASGSGGQKQMRELALRLRKDGYQVLDGFTIPSVCSPRLAYAKPKKGADVFISLACNAGSCNIMRMFPGQRVVDGTEDIGLMVTECDRNILKVVIPNESHADEDGKEYELSTGAKMATDSSLPKMEVWK